MTESEQIKGKLYATDYTESDIFDCISSYNTLTGHDPRKVTVRDIHADSLNWLQDLGVTVIKSHYIQPGEILLI